ncbi:hypothetical protein C8R48DRAFT_48817 [Suillus tomentosus]|nr:hypothetical protein C8R48DRAFT_48817 [Suillus tomentosus]
MSNSKFLPIIQQDETVLLTCWRTIYGSEQVPAECIHDGCMQLLAGTRGGNVREMTGLREPTSSTFNVEIRTDVFGCITIQFQWSSICGA